MPHNFKASYKCSNTLMVQGTTSDAGKSVLVSGLCRVLARHGYSVAPFKPQNMALNSAVTVDGGEIGRAQAVQARACFLEPHTDMNPVLLKPNSDIGAQVIIHGKAIGDMKAAKFHDYKKVAMTAVLDSHKRLTDQYQLIVVEGAGSPAEINLRENDIANMGFAETVDCPVIIVADIDRGGVFAHLVGTLELLSQSEQNRVVGFVINRFRGDIELLNPGLRWLEEKTGKPVLCVLPYLSKFHLEAEDAVAIEQVVETSDNILKVVVPVLSRISNHTDFDALRLHPQVDLKFVAVDAEPPAADVIILPGSKNVRSDLAALKKHGWPQKIAKHLRYGGKVMGICGGFQMLGKTISDPFSVEGEAGISEGLALFDIATELKKTKQLKRVTGLLVDALSTASTPLIGYEIHAGITTGPALLRPAVLLESDQAVIGDTCHYRNDGAISEDDQILGTYIHGVFDDAASCQALLQWCGLKEAKKVEYFERQESELNRLADALEVVLPLERIEQLLSIAPSQSAD